MTISVVNTGEAEEDEVPTYSVVDSSHTRR